MKIQKQIFSLCVLFIFVGINTSVAQASKADIFDASVPITWLGVDFSGAKLIGDREKYGSSSDVKFLIKSWNDLLEREYNKYNVGAALRKSKVDLKMDVTRSHNEELDISEALSNNASDYLHLKEEDIAAIIKDYDFQGLTGLGVMFNVESLNKLEQKAAVWVTFIDLNSKQVLLTERMIERAGGAGLRNYWARSFFDVIDVMRAKQFEAWRKKHAH
jgi:hypothetical protein